MIGDSEILLGYSYTVGNSIVGSIENVKFPVLDLNKIKTKYSTSITRKAVKTPQVIMLFRIMGCRGMKQTVKYREL